MICGDVIMTSVRMRYKGHWSEVVPGLALIGHDNVFLGKLDHFHANLKDLKISPLAYHGSVAKMT